MCSKKYRLEYLDFCKVFAIFLVTLAHCAQQLSGNKFPDLLLSKDSFISVNMAVFMLASGYVMNVEKMRLVSTWEFLKNKALRLLLPMTSWYLVLCIVSSQFPRFAVYWSIYWYLGAMFICLSTIKLLTIFIKSSILVAFISIIILSLIPMISFERSCYMVPFLWVGFLVRRYKDNVTKPIVILFLMLYIILYYFWDIRYSIYESPFHIWNVTSYTVYSLVFRFVIGVVGGTAIIYGSKFLIEYNTFKWMKIIAKFGPYTLVFYTMSFVLNSILGRLLWHINVYFYTPGILDVVSIGVTFIMMIIMYFFQVLIKKNRWLRLIFMGEK